MNYKLFIVNKRYNGIPSRENINFNVKNKHMSLVNLRGLVQLGWEIRLKE